MAGGEGFGFGVWCVVCEGSGRVQDCVSGVRGWGVTKGDDSDGVAFTNLNRFTIFANYNSTRIDLESLPGIVWGSVFGCYQWGRLRWSRVH